MQNQHIFAFFDNNRPDGGEQPKLLQLVRDAIRTEEAYVNWVERLLCSTINATQTR